ncbi:hypothetical protein [Halomonas sp. E14]|uniref:hypothetical protein n=1 Tax=Halomonas sp. E14 TaxID=3397245 RepID=UPI00403E36BF
MRQVGIPSLDFTRWKLWGERFDITDRKYPGVYVIAISDQDLSGKAVKWRNVVYIGMTKSKGGLSQRWSQLQNSLRGRNGHSGGWAIYKALGNFDEWNSNLFVAAMPIKCNAADAGPNDLRRLGWIAYLEYEAFSKFSRNVPGHRRSRFNTL